MRIRDIGAILVVVTSFVTVLAGTVFAHHSFTAEFDQNKPIKLSGKVTEMKFSNPHSWIYIDVETDGKIVNWALETGAANALIRRGWKKTDLPAGTVLQVEGWQARNGSSTANLSTVTFTDGRRLFAGSSNESAPTK
ncbi:MAG: hypothetical protein JWO19_2336 [Bryobacterales bacterium]|jgi:hypothetical protein|nr:hypothetical protein [Bryobacterales bacterium]